MLLYGSSLLLVSWTTWNCIAISLVPKNATPTKVKDFRPITYCSTLYKIMAKILTRRLKKVISDLVGCSQLPFIESRSIIDNIMFSHEFFKGYSRKGISPRCILMMDLRTAYDILDWHFLQEMMVDLGFPHRFVKWIMAYIITVSYSLVINMGLMKPFKGKRGIRMGDAISPSSLS